MLLTISVLSALLSLRSSRRSAFLTLRASICFCSSATRASSLLDVFASELVVVIARLLLVSLSPIENGLVQVLVRNPKNRRPPTRAPPMTTLSVVDVSLIILIGICKVKLSIERVVIS